MQSQHLVRITLKQCLPRLLGIFLLIAAAALSSPAHAALIGFFPFDGPDPLKDASGQGHDLQSAAADPTYLATGGLEGGAYTYDGSQRWIVPLDINPGTLPVMTMGAWVKTSSLVPGLRKIIGSDDGGWDRTIGLDDREGPFRYTSFIGNGTPAVGGPAPVSTNQWTFIAVTYDGNSSQLTLYTDLDAVASEPLAAVTVPASFGSGFATVAIGGIRPDNASEGWQGTIDNAFFFDELLTVERLTEIRDGGRTAILGQPSENPNLLVTEAPNLSNLGKVPSVKTLSYTVRNTGASLPLHLTRLTFAGTDAGYFTVQTLPATVAAGASAVIEIQFDSRGQVGAFSATATLESDDPGSPALLFDLTSRVVAAQTLLGYYTFDDPANPLKDDSGNGRTLLGSAAAPTYLPAGGFTGGAFDFNGTTRLAAPININPDVVPRFAMGAWVKTASLEPGLRKVLGSDDGAWDRVIGLDTRSIPAGGPLPDPTLRYAAFTGLNNHGPSQGDPPATPTSVDEWTFIAVDYDQANNHMALYVDLNAATTDDLLQVIEDDAPMGPGATSVGIGAINPNGGENWLGAIDNVFFISGAMDAENMTLLRDLGSQTLLQFTPDPVLAVLTGSVFGDLPNSSPKTVQIQVQNNGATQPLQLASAQVVGRDAANYSIGALPGPLAPGATASIAVTINPQGRLGLFNASLELISNDSGGRLRSVDLTATVPFTDPESALIGFYTFDDPANPLRDDSGHGNTLSRITGAEPIYHEGDGFRDGAFEFTGLERLIAPININPTARPVLTMGAWVKASGLGGLRKVIGSDDGGWDRTIGMDDREGGLRYTTFIGNGPPLAGTPVPDSTEVWSFMAATYDEIADQVVMYVDLDASTTDDPLVAVSGPTGFGSGFSTTAIGGLRPDNNAEGWTGFIDNAFFYDKVLTAAELTSLRDRELALASQLKIKSITRTAASVTITYRSKVGLLYSVEYKESWDQPWVFINIQAATSGTSSYTDDDPTRMAKPTGFYRVFTD